MESAHLHFQANVSLVQTLLMLNRVKTGYLPFILKESHPPASVKLKLKDI